MAIKIKHIVKLTQKYCNQNLTQLSIVKKVSKIIEPL